MVTVKAIAIAKGIMAAAMSGMTIATIAQTVATKAGAAAQWGLNAAMTANPIGIIIALVAGLVAGFVLLWNKSEGFRNFFIGMWEGIKGTFSTVVEFFGGIFSRDVDGIKNAFNGVREFFSNLFEAIANIVKAPINFIIRGINGFIGGLNKISIPDWGFPSSAARG